MRFRWLLLPVAAALLAWAGSYMSAHPYGDRFALGIWPVPQGTGWPYQLLSGFIPALTAISLVTLVSGAYHHVACHELGCARIGKHKVDGSPWCNRHQGKARASRAASLDDVVAKLDIIAGELKRWRSPSGLWRNRA